MLIVIDVTLAKKMDNLKNNKKNTVSTGGVKGNDANIKKNNAANSKQKVLLPTLREQQRYLVYKVIFNNNSSNSNLSNVSNISFDKIHGDILSQCNVLLGVFDGGIAGLMSAKFNPNKQSGILRVNNKYVDKLKVCLGMIKNSNSKSITIDCIYVSGMLNKAIDKMDNI